MKKFDLGLSFCHFILHTSLGGQMNSNCFRIIIYGKEEIFRAPESAWLYHHMRTNIAKGLNLFSWFFWQRQALY